MAVIQISKIQVRRGLNEDLPQLDSGELGWSIDTRQLFIGNGSLEEGAPATGVTEVLTTFSNNDLLATIEANVSILQSNVSTLQSNVASLQSSVGITSVTLYDNTTLANTSILMTSQGTDIIDYNIVRGTASRVGTIKATQYGGNVIYQDDYTESGVTGVTLGFSTFGSNAALVYTTTSTGSNANFNYYLKRFY